MLTQLDVLNDAETIKLCKRYVEKDVTDGTIFEKSLPANIETWEKLEPEFMEMPGWEQDISDAQRFEDLPVEAMNFIRQIEKCIKQKIEYVSVNDEHNNGILRILR